MLTLFEAAANMAERKRERERREALDEHTENLLEKMMNERRAEQEAAQEKAEAWDREITYALDKTGDLCTLLGAMVEAVRFENGIIWIRRPGEAIRLQVGEIRDAADLRAACKKMLGSVCKC